VFCCALLWAKGPNAKVIHKEMFPIYGGKCLSRKAVHNWVKVSLKTKRLKRRRESDRQQSKDFYAAGFRRTCKAMGHVYQCWWRICREVNTLFQVRKSHVLRFISFCGLFTDSPTSFYLILFKTFTAHWTCYFSTSLFLRTTWQTKSDVYEIRRSTDLVMITYTFPE
jgi:hypothetical protein